MNDCDDVEMEPRSGSRTLRQVAHLRRIIPAAAQRMASDDSAQGFPSTAKRAMFVQGVNRILAAGRLEPAVPAEQSPERDAIQQDELDQKPLHDR